MEENQNHFTLTWSDEVYIYFLPQVLLINPFALYHNIIWGELGRDSVTLIGTFFGYLLLHNELPIT